MSSNGGWLKVLAAELNVSMWIREIPAPMRVNVSAGGPGKIEGSITELRSKLDASYAKALQAGNDVFAPTVARVKLSSVSAVENTSSYDRFVFVTAGETAKKLTPELGVILVPPAALQIVLTEPALTGTNVIPNEDSYGEASVQAPGDRGTESKVRVIVDARAPLGVINMTAISALNSEGMRIELRITRVGDDARRPSLRAWVGSVKPTWGAFRMDLHLITGIEVVLVLTRARVRPGGFGD
jgi:hypothetical protein